MLEYIFSWTTFYYFLMVLYVPSCMGLIGIVLLQKGKGVGFAGAFGAGPGSEAVFGPRNIRSLPQKLTYTMATIFMVLAIIISIIYGRVSGGVAPELLDAAGPTGSYDELFEGGDAGGEEPDASATLPINVEVDGATPSGDAQIETSVTVETATPEEVEAVTDAEDVSDATPVSDVMEAAEEAADVAVEEAVEAVDTAVDAAEEAVDSAAETVEEAAADVEVAAEETVEAVEEAVSEDNAQ